MFKSAFCFVISFLAILQSYRGSAQNNHSNSQVYSIPPYADTSRFIEESIIVQTGKFKLPGIYTHPRNSIKKYPVVILVHGSGPNDMDESIFANKPFKDLAYGLATLGIASIRYDKRTKTYASQMIEKTNVTLEQETIQDALSAIRLARQMPDVDTNLIFVIGHSIGGMAAPRIAEYSGKMVAGIILLAAPARPLVDLLLEQTAYLNTLNPSPKKQKEFLELQKQVDIVKSGGFSPRTPSDQLPMGLAAPYWLYLNNYHQPEIAARLKIPILVLQGERDYQVSMTDFELWKKALSKKDNATFKSYPKLNHLFMEGEGGKSVPAEYETPSHVTDYVVKDIVDFIPKN